MDPLSQQYAGRVDEALYRAAEVLDELSIHEPESIEPIVAMLAMITEADDAGERIFRSWRANPPLPEEATPGAEIAKDAFDALREVAGKCLDCLAVTVYIVQRQTGPAHGEDGFSWRRVKPGGVVFDDIFFLNAPVHDRIDARGKLAVFGVQLTGGAPLPILVDAASRKHSLSDERFWFAVFDSLVGTPATAATMRTSQKEAFDVPLDTVDWTTLDRLWRPPTLPEGARSGPASLPPVSLRPSRPSTG